MKWPFFTNQRTKLQASLLNHELFPKHIAIIMDGNGRWATRKGMPRNVGHYQGMMTMRKIIQDCAKINLQSLTLYAFSTENWTRDTTEVNYLVKLPIEFFQDNTIAELVQHNIRVHYSGDISRFPEETIQILQKVQAATSGCSGMILNMALNYGGKAEVLQACKSYIQTVIDGNEKLEDFSEDVFEQYLYTNGLPPVDLMIRTSGEVRLSNFLLWQSGSSELWFTKELWPDFNRGLLMEAIGDYIGRKQERIAT